MIQQELDRRLAAAQAADPTRSRTQAVERDLARVGTTVERLLTAYQEDLVSLDQLRERMPLLRQHQPGSPPTPSLLYSATGPSSRCPR